ncbi:MAG TPA: hypothetical protein VJV79_24635, partial [Polyangiaceae bacterium]|nr:hypothetical protein [Polyangiaceae bacterium]
WSPDGRWLLYWVGSELYCRDMSAAVPGSPLLLISGLSQYLSPHVTPLTWSADSKTVGVASVPVASSTDPQTVFQVLDPSRAAPPISTLSNSVQTVAWAPTGERVLFAPLFFSSSTAHVRSVTAGVPGADVTINGATFAWSADGKSVANVVVGSGPSVTGLILTDVSQATPSPVTIPTSPTIAAPSVARIAFSPDGSALLFSGAQLREGAYDLFRVPLKPAVGAPVLVSTGLTGTVSVSSFAWSPDGKWATYTVYGVASGTSPNWAVNMSGASPGTPFQPGAIPGSSSSWLVSAPQKFLASYNSNYLLVDLSNPSATPTTIFSGSVSAAAMNPLSSILAFGVTSHLYLRDLEHLENPATDFPISAASPSSLRWSPNGQFLSFVLGGQLRLARADGMTLSTAITLSSISSSAPSPSWQPQ